MINIRSNSEPGKMMDAPCFGESIPGITWSAEAVSGSLPTENKKEWHSLAPASTKFEKQRIA